MSCAAPELFIEIRDLEMAIQAIVSKWWHIVNKWRLRILQPLNQKISLK
jgi:hypothetical protein